MAPTGSFPGKSSSWGFTDRDGDRREILGQSWKNAGREWICVSVAGMAACATGSSVGNVSPWLCPGTPWSFHLHASCNNFGFVFFNHLNMWTRLSSWLDKSRAWFGPSGHPWRVLWKDRNGTGLERTVRELLCPSWVWEPATWKVTVCVTAPSWWIFRRG